MESENKMKNGKSTKRYTSRQSKIDNFPLEEDKVETEDIDAAISFVTTLQINEGNSVVVLTPSTDGADPEGASSSKPITKTFGHLEVWHLFINLFICTYLYIYS